MQALPARTETEQLIQEAVFSVPKAEAEILQRMQNYP